MSKTKKLLIIVVIVLMLIAIGVVVWNNKAKNTKQAGKQPAPSTDTLLTGAQPPTDYPSDLPLASDFSLHANYAGNVNGTSVFTRSYYSDQSVDTLYQQYKNYFAVHKEWKVVTDTGSSSARFISAKQGGAFLNITIQTQKPKSDQTRTDISMSGSVQ
jgi:hypothetical protein